VALVCAAVFGLLTLLRAGPRARVLFAALALIGFVILARPSPSVLRAAVMAASRCSRSWWAGTARHCPRWPRPCSGCC